MTQLITSYFQANGGRFWGMLGTHLTVSVLALICAALIGVPAGWWCVRRPRSQKFITGFFGFLRVVPSLAILLLMVPIMGTGKAPVIVALVILAIPPIPPILINTVTGLEGVPAFMLETAEGIGMTETQVWRSVRFPLAMPMILTGVKTAAVEIVASATLASKIGAGGLGDRHLLPNNTAMPPWSLFDQGGIAGWSPFQERYSCVFRMRSMAVCICSMV